MLPPEQPAQGPEIKDVIDDFAWSVEPKKDEADRLRLREMTPEIERLLRQGLASTGLHEGHLQELWDEVARIYRQQQVPATASRAPTAPIRCPRA